MANIFVSYTSSDRHWALWVAQELEALGHTPRVHEWEISGGGDIPGWIEESLEKADHCLLVVSETYLTKPYSSWERRAAQWAAASSRPNFALPMFIKEIEPPILLAHLIAWIERRRSAHYSHRIPEASGKTFGATAFSWRRSRRVERDC
jgi:TIR domain